MNSAMRNLGESFQNWPDGVLSALLIGAGLIYITIGIFSHNLVFKSAAAAYAVFP